MEAIHPMHQLASREETSSCPEGHVHSEAHLSEFYSKVLENGPHHLHPPWLVTRSRAILAEATSLNPLSAKAQDQKQMG